MGGGWKTDYARYRGYFQNAITTAQKKQDVKMFLEILLTLSAIIIFVSLALRPTLITISELVKDIDSKRELVAQMDLKLNNLRQARTLLDQEARRISLLDTAVPTKPDPDKFAVQIEGASAYNQTQLMGLSIDELILLGNEKKRTKSQEENALPQGANSLAFSFNNQGNFLNLENLISYLENMRRPLQIDTLNINKSVTELAEFLSITITGQAPYLKEVPETE
jgi:hypothetical protein